MRQIAMAVMMYADDHKGWFPRTMDEAGGMPETISWWRLDGYHKTLEEYIGRRSGVKSDGQEERNSGIWFDPLDPDREVPAMWGSFVDNGFLTGVPRKIAAVRRSSETIMMTLRSRGWTNVSIAPPQPLPLANQNDPFWSSEFFDVCLDPWADTPDKANAFHWSRGRACPPKSLFPEDPDATAWDQQIDGRRPEQKGQSRYGRGQWYSFVDGSVRFMDFAETFRSKTQNMWSP